MTSSALRAGASSSALITGRSWRRPARRRWGLRDKAMRPERWDGFGRSRGRADAAIMHRSIRLRDKGRFLGNPGSLLPASLAPACRPVGRGVGTHPDPVIIENPWPGRLIYRRRSNSRFFQTLFRDRGRLERKCRSPRRRATLRAQEGFRNSAKEPTNSGRSTSLMGGAPKRGSWSARRPMGVCRPGFQTRPRSSMPADRQTAGAA